MNPFVQLNLALILFLPWYSILALAYWCYPRQPRTAHRRLFDVAALATAFAATTLGLHWGHASAGPGHGEMWRQVLGTSVSYGIFLALLAAAFLVRRRVFAPTVPGVSP
jgi:hypothetical protein